MNNFNSEEVLKACEDIKNIDGDLCLAIYCTKCNAQFELNKESIVMAIATNCTVWDYVKWVQGSKCSVCNKEQQG